jgi:hypothetical protein
MRCVPGETIPRRILGGETFTEARRVLVGDLGRFLAGLHAIDPAELSGADVPDSLGSVWDKYCRIDDRSATFEKAYDWLLANRPPPTGDAIIHGDSASAATADRRAERATDRETVRTATAEDLARLIARHGVSVNGRSRRVGTIDSSSRPTRGGGGRSTASAVLVVVQKTRPGHRQSPGRLPPVRRSAPSGWRRRRRVPEQEGPLELLAPTPRCLRPRRPKPTRHARLRAADRRESCSKPAVPHGR